MNKLLVIIDMINGFVNEGALADPKINEITPTIIKYIESSKAEKTPIIFFRDSHNINDEEFKTYPVHALAGSSESAIIPELTSYAKLFKIIDKQTTNGYETKAFKDYIQNTDIKEVIVTGCCTDICIKDFSTSLKHNHPEIEVIVPINAVSTFDSKDHNKEKHQLETFEYFKSLGIILIN